MNRLNIKKLNLDGLHLIERVSLGDERGFLSRIWCSDEMKKAGWSESMAQINHTYNQKCGTVRGLHFQREPYEENTTANETYRMTNATRRVSKQARKKSHAVIFSKKE